MILCVCTGITDGKLRWAVETGGAKDAEEAFQVLGLRPGCRRCQASMEAAVEKMGAGEEMAPEGEGQTAWTCRGGCVPAWGMPRTAFAG